MATRVETLVTIFVQFNTAVRPVSSPAAALLFCSPRSPGGGVDLGRKALLGAVVPLGVVLRVQCDDRGISVQLHRGDAPDGELLFLVLLLALWRTVLSSGSASAQGP